MKLLFVVGAAVGVTSMAVAPSLHHEHAKADGTHDPGLPEAPLTDQTVDKAATRGGWVASYSYSGKFKWEQPERWLPTGPEYLDIDALEKGYLAHLVDIQSPTSWLRSGTLSVKRFLAGRG
ncbi:hypothetical protein GGTG_04771 [Gaeumannomyces tritici R3-111a-1]|uniref:Uncharacterized protein n=1 Tax=Gaeumannomyces tritici (strain R3-111a-1) TaxID=644352 RepID=J3NU20_GAET3|nr:hypothetical protein GGTG_04771 [Gaeumannomyces tritici R3-111a-1]EJT79687.1 hypothetical protein GGTG_04771 [Gaeumannomyces tritici R3-111a-1]